MLFVDGHVHDDFEHCGACVGSGVLSVGKTSYHLAHKVQASDVQKGLTEDLSIIYVRYNCYLKVFI